MHRHATRLIMIIPSMGRPAAAGEAARSAIENATSPWTSVLIAVDGPHEPEQRDAYRALVGDHIFVAFSDEHRGMVGTLNRAAWRMAHPGAVAADHECPMYGPCGYVTHLGFMGDDHRVRTHGWDERLTDAAGYFGLSYGDDLLRGPELPTAVVMGADIVRTLGAMAPPTLGHLYVDDYWRTLGEELDALRYVPDVVIEHMHPAAGKAEIDASYETTNHPDQYARDRAAWEEYRLKFLGRDVDAVSFQATRLAWKGIYTLPGVIE